MAVDIDRRLSTIMCADVAGYSALMERDEDGTLRRLKDFRGRLIKLIEHHRGRVANTAGDGVLCEFPSAIEAVRAAIDVQTELGGLNDALPTDRQMHFRIGINVGDVMDESGDLFGEGVNVAARLQALAEPGSILISGPVHDLVRSKLDISYEFLGPRQVRNMATAVPVYRVDIAGASSRPHRHSEPPSTSDEAPDRQPTWRVGVRGLWSSLPLPARQRTRWAATVAGAIVAAAVLVGDSWMAIVAAVVLWLGLTHASRSVPMKVRHQLAVHFVLLTGFLASINLLTSPGTLWVVYPAIPLLALAFALGSGMLPGPRDNKDRSSE